MRIFRYILFIILCFALVSCGGGGGGSSSSGATVKFKLNFESSQRIKSLFEQNGRLKISNTDIGYVALGYHKVGGTGYTLDVTNAALNNTDISVTGLEVGSSYIFSVSAFADGTQADLVCTGSSDSVQIANSVDVNLTCSLDDAADVARMVADIAELMESVLTDSGNYDTAYAALESYVSTESFYHDGMTREEFMLDILSSSYEFLDATHIVSITISQSLERSGTRSSKAIGDADMSSADIIFTYDNGAKVRKPANFIYEDGRWKLTGNDRFFEYDIHVESIIIPDKFGNADFYSGLKLDFFDENTPRRVGNVQISSDYTEEITLDGTYEYLPIFEPLMSTGISGIDPHFVPVEVLTSGAGEMPEGSEIDVHLDFLVSRSFFEDVTLKTTGAGLSAADADSSYFPHLYADSDNPSVNNNDTAGDIDFTIIPPSAEYTLAYYEVSILSLYTYMGTTVEHYKLFKLSPTQTSITLNIANMLNYLSTQTGYMSISAVDTLDRRYTEYYRIYDGNLIIGTSDERPTLPNTGRLGADSTQKTLLYDNTFSFEYAKMLNDNTTLLLAGSQNDTYYYDTFGVANDNSVGVFYLLKYNPTTNTYSSTGYRVLGRDDYSGGGDYGNLIEVSRVEEDSEGNLYLLCSGWDPTNYEYLPFVYKLNKTSTGYTLGWAKSIYESDFNNQKAVDFALNNGGESLVVLTDRSNSRASITILSTEDGSVTDRYVIYDTVLSGQDIMPQAVGAYYDSPNFVVAGDVSISGTNYIGVYYMNNTAGGVAKKVMEYSGGDPSVEDVIVTEDGLMYVSGVSYITGDSAYNLFITSFMESSNILSSMYGTTFRIADLMPASSLAYDRLSGQFLLAMPNDGPTFNFARLDKALNVVRAVRSDELTGSSYGNVVPGPHSSSVYVADDVFDAGSSKYTTLVSFVSMFSDYLTSNSTSEVRDSYNYGTPPLSSHAGVNIDYEASMIGGVQDQQLPSATAFSIISVSVE